MKTLKTRAQNVVVVGEDFAVALDEPAATGYLFRPIYDLGILELLSERHSVSQPFADECRADFRFRARSAGSCEISFDLRAPWDPDPAAVCKFQLRIFVERP